VSSGGAEDDDAGVNVRVSMSMFSSGAAVVVVRMSVFMSSSECVQTLKFKLSCMKQCDDLASL
jgi:hypothetical protein